MTVEWSPVSVSFTWNIYDKTYLFIPHKLCRWLVSFCSRLSWLQGNFHTKTAALTLRFWPKSCRKSHHSCQKISPVICAPLWKIGEWSYSGLLVSWGLLITLLHLHILHAFLGVALRRNSFKSKRLLNWLFSNTVGFVPENCDNSFFIVIMTVFVWFVSITTVTIVNSSSYLSPASSSLSSLPPPLWSSCRASVPLL